MLDRRREQAAVGPAGEDAVAPLEGAERKLATMAGLTARQKCDSSLAFVIRGDGTMTELAQAVAEGLTLAEFNGLQGMIADLATDVEVARLLTLRAAYLKDTGRPAMHAAAMAKLFASEAAMKAATKAVQIHGGAGYITEFPVERIFRDAKLTEIGEGTSEIQRLVIAREILQGS